MKQRLNAIDAALIILAVALLAGGLLVFSLRPTETNTERLRCTVRTAPIPRALLRSETPQAGALVRETVSGETLGEVLSVSVIPATYLTADGEALLFAESDSEVVMEAELRLEVRSRSVGNVRLAAGGRIDLILGDRLAEGCEVIVLEVVDDE